MARNISSEQYSSLKYIELPVRERAPLMEFILKQMSGTSKNRVKDLLRGHAVTVDRKLATKYDQMLDLGQMVRVSRHKRSTELTSKFVKIIYEDKHVIVIEKSPGILSMASSHKQFCIKTILDEYFKKRHFQCTAHVVHRLDRETSGLMVYAKTMEAKKVLTDNWHDVVFDRRYVAVLCGRVPEEGGTVHSWLKDNKAFFTYSSPEDNGGKEAITYWRKLNENNDFTLAEFKLETGRKNQIRVHANDMGYPVAGDDKYGNGRNPFGRLALHAYRLNFYHPITGEPMKFETSFPTPFLNLFKQRQ